LISIKAAASPASLLGNVAPPASLVEAHGSASTARSQAMKETLAILSGSCAAAAALLWFVSARLKFKSYRLGRIGQGNQGVEDLVALMQLVSKQSRLSAWAAIAAGFAALFAIIDGLAALSFFD
jgi:hypothetical protein